MSEEDSETRRRLIELIRRIAKDVIYEVLDEYLEDYEHEKGE